MSNLLKKYFLFPMYCFTQEFRDNLSDLHGRDCQVIKYHNIIISKALFSNLFFFVLEKSRRRNTIKIFNEIFDKLTKSISNAFYQHKVCDAFANPLAIDRSRFFFFDNLKLKMPNISSDLQVICW